MAIYCNLNVSDIDLRSDSNATIKPVKNCENVEKFELFVIPERHSSISTFSSGHHSYDKGHVRAGKTVRKVIVR